MHTYAFIAVYSGEQVWTIGLLFLKNSPVKQYSYKKDFSGVFDALHQSFLVYILQFCLTWRQQVKRTVSKWLSQLTTVG